jgi:transporter family protein
MLPSWTLLAFLAPLLWSLVGFMDKFVISKYIQNDQGAESLVIFTGLTGFIMATGIFLFGHPVTGIPTRDVLCIMIAGIIYVAAFIPYLTAMKETDASVVVSLFQLSPIFSYVLGLVFLGERLSTLQMLAGVLVIAGAVSLSSDPKKPFRPTGKTFGLMALSSFGLATSALLFKYFALDSLDPWATAFWEYVGAGIFAIFLLVSIAPYRKQFVSLLDIGGARIAALNLSGEILTVFGTLAMSFASLSAPLAVVSIINGTQPFIMLIIGGLLTLFLPHIISEQNGRARLVHRIVSSAVIFAGVVLLFA